MKKPFLQKKRGLILLVIATLLFYWFLFGAFSLFALATMVGPETVLAMILGNSLLYVVGILFILLPILGVLGYYFLNKDSKEGNLNLSEMRKEGWQWSWSKKKFRTYFVFILILGVLAGIIEEIFQDTLMVNFPTYKTLFSILSWIIQLIFSAVIALGLAEFGLSLVQNINFKIKDYVKKLTRSKVWNGVVAYLLVTILIGIWFILLVVPGLIVAIRLKFVFFAIAHRGMRATEALKWSWKITKGHFRDIVAFELYFGMINLLGGLCLLVGLIITVPIYLIAQGKFYLLLEEEYEKNLNEKEES